jgi:Arc-like DNA binding domain
MEKIYRSQFRLPIDLYERLKILADENGTSLNAELVQQLEFAVNQPQAAKALERRKSELICEFIRWCVENGKDPNGAKQITEFCERYNGAPQILSITDLSTYSEDCSKIKRILTIENIEPRYLSNLYYVWCIETPKALGQSSNNNVAATAASITKMLAPELKSMSDEISSQVLSKLLATGILQNMKSEPKD